MLFNSPFEEKQLALRQAHAGAVAEDKPALEARMVEIDQALELGLPPPGILAGPDGRVAPRWITRAGFELRIDLISDSHLRNALAMAQRVEERRAGLGAGVSQNILPDRWDDTIRDLERELRRRTGLST